MEHSFVYHTTSLRVDDKLTSRAAIMGRSSPPFLYDRPSNYTFYGPTDRGFHPKAVTQASWAREQPKPKTKGPLVNINRHPDSWASLSDGKFNWQPMSPSTKGRVKYGRLVQLVLRILALLGALGSLFCSIVIKNAAATVIWIIRAGPAAAVLHTLYGIYHLCRSPVTRPPGSQASYMLFASTFDAGLIPFYAFTAFMAYGQYTLDTYNWDTLFKTVDSTYLVAQATFYLGVVNVGFHLISLGLSIFLAVIFRQISKLPPDLNPLEDNLTSRSRKRNRSEITEKHMSQATLDSALSSMEDPLIGPPRSMPFMHTRNKSSVDTSSHRSEVQNERRQSFQSRRFTYAEPSSPEAFLHEPPIRPKSFITNTTAVQHADNFPAQPINAMIEEVEAWDSSSAVPNRDDNLSPDSDNWIAYPSRSPSPVDNAQNENLARRDPSSIYSRSNTTASTNSGIKDWISSAQRYGRDKGSAIAEDTRGEYESLAMHEYYGLDEDNAHQHPPRNGGLYDANTAEQDLGDHRIDIYTDHDESYMSDSLRPNPLAMNPPTPRPILDDESHNDPTNSAGRPVLGDIPNLSSNQPHLIPPPIESPQKKGRFYGELENNASLSIPRGVSGQDEAHSRIELTKKRSKVLRRKSGKQNASNAAIKDHHDDEHQPADPATTEGDRKGRVVSNSGADIAARNALRSGSNLSYGNYIAGLGVGRRRDVSGKVAEEGRGGTRLDPLDKEFPGTSGIETTTKPIRAAGWARFAGL